MPNAEPNAEPDDEPGAGAGLPPALARGLKQRLFERVADAETRHLTVAADAGDWQPWLDGVAIKVLHEHAGVMSYLLRLAPGATLPAHRHRQDEECLVLEGRLQVGRHVELGPGGYHLALSGSLHATVGSVGGALVFLRGGVPEVDDALL